MDRSRQKELIEYQRTPHWFDANRPPLVQEAHYINGKCPPSDGQIGARRMFGEVSMKILRNFWSTIIICLSESVDQPVRSTGETMSNSSPDRNKATVLEAFETLFNKRDYAAAERFWSPNYIQHSAHIAPGREGLFNLIRSVPDTLHYENQVIIAEGDYVIAHGRFTGMGRPAAWIAADIIRFEDGVLREHWDVLQDEATKAESVSGLPMFGNTFPK
jgi:predicted SnoaL-like aldol condensation-catalyzing enzyme